MKYFKRITGVILLVTMMMINIPVEAFAANEEDTVVSMDNGYLQYSINRKTGGFSIYTQEGHPQKKYDNNIPLLFQEDSSSTQTSFTTVRIDGKDYIFGQDYGWFGIDSKLEEPIVNNVDKTIITKWTIKGIEVSQKVALSGDPNNDLAGNVGIAYEVKNTTRESKNVGIRTLLDTALGELDAPYMVAGYESTPTITEREFSGSDVPDQIRGMDSMDHPARMSYSILKGWSNGAAPDRVIVGHWGNLANTRYDYTPNKNCDFSNYSSAYKTPDSALAFYWSEDTVSPEAVRKAEFLYGIGNFSNQLTNANVSINMDIDRVFVTDDKKGYKNDGIFEVRVDIDNTVDNAKDLSFATLNLSLEDGLSIVEDPIEGEYNLGTSENITIESIPAGTVAKKYWRVKADPQTTISAKQIAVSLYTNTTEPLRASRYIILPSATGNLPQVRFDSVTPSKFYISGDKNINVTGDLEPFEALQGKAGWGLYLRQFATGDLIEIQKDKIAFNGDQFNTLSLTTDEDLTVGEYEIVFKFFDTQLIHDFTNEIVIQQKIEVTLDESLKNKSYGIITVVRYDKDKYKFLTFPNEEELVAYRKIHKLNSYNCTESEMLLEVRGKIREYTRFNGSTTETYYAADPGASEVTLNNVVNYSGKEALVLKEENGTLIVSGDGDISVIDNLTFWNSGFTIRFQTGMIHTLEPEKVKLGQGDSEAQVKNVLIQYSGVGKVIQNIGGMTMDLKYGVLTENWGGKREGEREGYAINFGGKLAITFLKGDSDSSTSTPQSGTGGSSGNNIKKDKPESVFDDGTVCVNIENVLFGENEEKVDFLGVNAKAELSLPKKVFGGFIANAPGLYGELTINTLDDIYAVKAGVQLYVIECMAELQIKVVEINDVQAPIPDKLHFSVSSEIGVPIAPPALYLTKLGGGYENLADTLTGNYMGSMPPLTLNVQAGIKVVNVLNGDFDLSISLRGMSLVGQLSINKIKGLSIEAGIQTQWVDPWYLHMYGELNVFEVIQGGVSITIANDYFYGYGYVSLVIPKSIPLVGGKSLAKIEAALSNELIGMNIKVLFLKFGVAYYWDQNEVDFGSTIDLGGIGKRMMTAMYVQEEPFGSESKGTVAMYGTNVRRLATKVVTEEPMRMMAVNTLAAAPASTPTSTVKKDVQCAGSDNLLLEIPYTGVMIANPDQVIVTNPNGKQIYLTVDHSMDGGPEGNFMVQDMGEEGKYIYISVIHSGDIVDGTWTVSSVEPMVEVTDFEVSAVDNIPEITAVHVGDRTDNSSNEVEVAWAFDHEGSKLDKATVDLYLTTNKNIVDEAKKNGVTDTNSLGVCIGQYFAKHKKAVAKIPDTINSDTYYIVAVLALDDCGPSIVVNSKAVVFENHALPVPVQKVNAVYGGNGRIKVDITNPNPYDYTHYNVFVTDEAGSVIDNAMGNYTVGDSIILGANGILKEGNTYKVLVQTVKVINEKTYISDSQVYSDPFIMPEAKIPVLQSMESNIDSTTKYSKENHLQAKYTFDQEVNLKVLINNVDYMKSDEYKKEWEFTKELPDGEYVITIEAVNKMDDTYSENLNKTKASNIASSVLAYTIDTMIPVLKIGSSVEDSFKENTKTSISNQTVWLRNGQLTFNGLTEAGAVLTLDGSGDGITVGSDGVFTIHRAMDLDGILRKSMTLEAIDKAGNKNETIIYVADGDISTLEGLHIKNVTENRKTTDIDVVDGYKTMTIHTGKLYEFTAVNAYRMSNGSVAEYSLLPEQLNWSVLYGSNLIDFSDGIVYAKASGEVALKAECLSASFKEGEQAQEQQVSTEDVVILEIEGEPVYPSPDDNHPGDEEDDDLSRRPKKGSKSNYSVTLISQMNKRIAGIGEKNVIKTIRLNTLQQVSTNINERLNLTVPVYSVDQDEILILYRPDHVEQYKAGSSQTILGDIMTMTTVLGNQIQKPVVFEYDYSKDHVSNPRHIGLYRYNKLFKKWEYVLGENNTTDKKITVEAAPIDGIYAFIDNSTFSPYSDIGNHWAEEYIYRLSSLSIIHGVKDGNKSYFYPDKEITRAEFIKLAVVSMRVNPEDYKDTQLPFVDMDQIPQWAVNYIKAAYRMGWLKGKRAEDGLRADVSIYITREEAATLLYRIKSVGSEESVIEFTDKELISEFAMEAVKRFASRKIISGYTDGSFRPANNIKRCEAAKVIMEWINTALK